MEAAFRVPPLSVVCHAPRIYVADGFVSRDEAGYIRRLGQDPAKLHSWGIQPKRDATGTSFEMPMDGDAVLEAVRHRVQAVLGLENVHGRTMRYRQYRAGDGHPPHLDCFEIQGSHLVATALINLTDCAGGGETRFPRAYPSPVEIRPARGRLVCWFNYYPNGAPDQSSMHEGAAITAGEKITLTAFIYRPLSDSRHRPPVGVST